MEREIPAECPSNDRLFCRFLSPLILTAPLSGVPYHLAAHWRYRACGGSGRAIRRRRGAANLRGPIVRQRQMALIVSLPGRAWRPPGFVEATPGSLGLRREWTVGCISRFRLRRTNGTAAADRPYREGCSMTNDQTINLAISTDGSGHLKRVGTPGLRFRNPR